MYRGIQVKFHNSEIHVPIVVLGRSIFRPHELIYIELENNFSDKFFENMYNVNNVYNYIEDDSNVISRMETFDKIRNEKYNQYIFDNIRQLANLKIRHIYSDISYRRGYYLFINKNQFKIGIGV